MGKWEMVQFADVLEIVNGRNQKQVENPNGKYPIYGSGGVMGYADDYLCDAETVVIGRKGTISRPIFVSEPFWNVDTAFGLSAKQSVLFPKYLYYFCNQFDFEALNTTVTIPSLTKANLLKIQIPLPPLPIQQKIADALDKASALIEMRKAQIDKLDLLIKSQFIEMFGDPVTNLKGWEKQCWSSLFDTTTGKLDSNAMKPEGTYPFFTCAKEAYCIDTYAFDCEALILAGNNASGIYDVKHYSGKFNAYQRTYVLTLRNKGNQYRVFRYLLEQKLEQMRYSSKGTNTKYLTLGMLNKLEFIVPQELLQKEFETFAHHAEMEKKLHLKALDMMILSYKSIIQKCFSGEMF